MRSVQAEASAYILQNTVSHARYIPATSQHVFTYPTLAFLLSLSALESHQLDLGQGRVFGYSNADFLFPLARVTGIRPEAYLHDSNAYEHMKRKSIKEKLEDVLVRFGHDASELEDAWMLTMPSYLGVEGINPLTVFYCYHKASDLKTSELWIIVLEVHNTFGERNVYVLPTGVTHQDEDTPSGYTHSWTFPRQFHVSPFNDRSGYYNCSLIAPSYPPSASRLDEVSTNPRNAHLLPVIRIQLYTPDKMLKLTATLRPTSAIPLTSQNLLASLAKYPMTLLLSFFRIAWQAFHLHYQHRLDVFSRPEPRAVDPELESRFTETLQVSKKGTMMEKVVIQNEVQRDEEQFGVGGGVGWQPEGILERFARKRLEQFLNVRADSTGIRVHLVSTNPASGTKTFTPGLYSNPTSDSKANSLSNPETPQPSSRELIVLTRSPRAFLLILASPSPAHALLLARDAEQLLTVSDEALFYELFSLLQTYKQQYVQRTLQWMRKLPMPRVLVNPPEDKDKSELVIPTVLPLDILFTPPYAPSSPPLRLGPVNIGLRSFLAAFPTLLVLSAFFALTYLEKAIFTLLGARFVKGMEPWGMWERAEAVWLARRTSAFGSGER